MKRYNPKEIEPKWQAKWAESKLYAAKDFDKTRQKFVMLTEFPYPSGDGLHMGHVREYTLGDIMARHKRMQGYNVLYPMGYDCFGLPTENYAIKNRVTPQAATETNTGNFQKQFSSLGYSIDWDRAFKTSHPDYYKWTQWLFLQFFKEGLAYQEEIAINWCPKCKTGLANEEVINGRHERCDTLVEKKQLKQWLLKITKYADRLIEGLEMVDYPSRIADQQVNWIGRSVGAEVDFALNVPNNYVLLHGFTATSKDNFHPWLKKNLEKDGATIYCPDLPHTDKPNADEQATYVLQNGQFDENTTLLGHSYGSVTALKILEKLDKPIKKLVLVAGFAEPSFLDRERNFEKTTDWDLNFEKIKQNAGEVVILRATNDSAVPQERADFLQQKLGGTIIDFTATQDHACGQEEPTVLSYVEDKITVFTTRPDTLFGATFMVLAPEHPLVTQITTEDQKAAVNSYVKAAQGKSEIERQDTSREKTGVFTGAYALNPVNNEKVPVWIADYVLGGYGTGAIMAVPAHDQRDYEFAQKFNIPIKQVVMTCADDPTNPPRDGFEEVVRDTVIVHLKDKSTGKYAVLDWHESLEGITTAIMGGIEEGQTPAEAALTEIREEAALEDVTITHQLRWVTAARYCASHKKQNRKAIAYGLLAEVDSLDGQGKIAAGEQKLHTLNWVSKEEVLNRLTPDHQKLVWEQLNTEAALTGEGELINSGPYNGLTTSEARDKIVADLVQKGLGKERVNYKLRDWIFSRQHYWGEPIPIIHCSKCGAVPVPEDQLPVELPKVENYEPTDTGESPLAAIRDWVEVDCPKCGGAAERETDTMPNWAGSSWYYLRYYDAHNDQAFADKKKLEYWGAVDMYLGGMEHTTLHLLYSRFWHQFFYDQGLVPTPEPYAARRGQGIVLAADGSKMSKSKGNVINPSDVIEQGYGADALRTLIAFLAPFDQTTPWNPEGVAGTFRFLQRVWTLVYEYNDAKPEATVSSKALLTATHKAIRKVSQDLENMGFNTAVATLMELTNELYKIKAEDKFVSKEWSDSLSVLVQLVAPFAPHIAEELWHELGHKGSVHVSDWPKYDEKYLVSDEVTIVVQVNGKVRANVTAPVGADEAAVVELAQADENVQQHLSGKTIRKTIYIANKLISFVV